jgi:cytochrome c oxidase subunit 1
MSRRIPTYNPDSGFNFWNLMATIGAFTIAVSLLVFFCNIFVSYRAHKKNPAAVGPDPWDARSLEWMVPSPTPEHNFDQIPKVDRVRPLLALEVRPQRRWSFGANRQYRGRGAERYRPPTFICQSPSYWPIVLAAGLPFIGYGVIFNPVFAVVGALLVVGGMIGWVLEPPDAVDGDAHGHSHESDGHTVEPATDSAEGSTESIDSDSSGEGTSTTAGDGNE